MAKLPRPLSRDAVTLQSAISEGRAEEAMHKLIAALESGQADKAVQLLAANWIKTIGLKPGDAKALRNGAKELPKEWIDIAEFVQIEQDSGKSYRAAVAAAGNYFGYGRRHVENCVTMYRRAAQDAREFE